MTLADLIHHPFFKDAVTFIAIWLLMCVIAQRAET